MEANDHCAALVRERDRDRWLADLFAPAGLRPHLFALHAFDGEIDRIRATVSEPMLGEVRLQWWRDALAGGGSGHPVADALGAAVTAHRLPPEAFAAYLDARIFDLYDDPMPDMNTLEGYAGETSAAILQLSGLVLGGAGDLATAAGHAGVALTLTRVLRGVAADPARHQAFLPSDVLARHGVPRDALAAGEKPPGLAGALAELRAAAREHLARAGAAIAGLPAAVKPAFLPLATVAPALARLEAGRGDLAPWRRQWLIWRAARRG